jgi:hypothetical protein
LRIIRELRDPADLFLFLRMFFFALSVPLLLRLKLPTLQRLLEPTKPPSNYEPAMVQRISASIDRLVRFGQPLFRSVCLARGTTLYYFLRRAGVDVSLFFGIRKSDTGFIGHCWIVRDGVPFMEAQDPRLLYTAIYSIPQNLPDKAAVRAKDFVLKG